MEQFRNAHRVLVGKPESKRPLGRARRRWEDNIKMEGHGLRVFENKVLRKIFGAKRLNYRRMEKVT